jgi:hypothetical protein
MESFGPVSEAIRSRYFLALVEGPQTFARRL